MKTVIVPNSVNTTGRQHNPVPPAAVHRIDPR